jgi:hypothetical protein
VTRAQEINPCPPDGQLPFRWVCSPSKAGKTEGERPDLHIPERHLTVEAQPREDRSTAGRVADRARARAPDAAESDATRAKSTCGKGSRFDGWRRAARRGKLVTWTSAGAKSAASTASASRTRTTPLRNDEGARDPAVDRGKLYACNECKRCNERAGHGAEAALVGDPAVRSAAESIAEEIPWLIRRMRQRKVFIAQSESGLLVGAVRDNGGEFKILQTSQPDGSRTASVG